MKFDGDGIITHLYQAAWWPSNHYSSRLNAEHITEPQNICCHI